MADGVRLVAFLADSFAPVPAGSAAIVPVPLYKLPESEHRGELDFHLVAPGDDFVVAAKPFERVTAPGSAPSGLEKAAGHHLAYSVPYLVELDFAAVVASGVAVDGVPAFVPLGHSEPSPLASVQHPSLNDPSEACAPSCCREGWLGSFAEQVFHAS